MQANKISRDTRTHYLELDALRGIAILGVVICHLAGTWTAYAKALLSIPLLNADLTQFLSFGQLGVSLFFLLSGYLLTWTEQKRVRNRTYSIRGYALRRVLRLVPAYYAVILLIVLTTPRPTSANDILWHASFLHALNPYTAVSLDPVFWSLTPEVIFYCLLPFIILKVPRVSHRFMLFGVFFFASFALLIYMAQMGPAGHAVLFWRAALCNSVPYLFMAGVLLRMLVEHLEKRDTSFPLRASLGSTLFVTSITTMVAMMISTAFIGGDHRDILQGEGDWLILLWFPMNLAVIAFFASAVIGTPLLRRVLAWNPLALVGMISYSLFLLHKRVLLTSASFLGNVESWRADYGTVAVWAIFCVYGLAILTVAGILAYLSYRFIESPFLRYRVSSSVLPLRRPSKREREKQSEAA